MTVGLSDFIPNKHVGPPVNLVPVVQGPRRPTVNDKKHLIWTEWRVKKDPQNGEEGEFWKLIKFEANGDAKWVLIGPGDTDVQTINLDAGSVSGTTLSYIGSTVLNAAHAKPIFTTGAGTGFQVDVQLATTSTDAAKNINKSGISHYFDGDFTIDAATGFVRSRGRVVKWEIITASQTMAINTGYICASPGGALNLLLPATATLGDLLEVTLDGATSFTITQAAGQQIRYNNLQTTAGVGGSISSTDQGNSIRMVAQSATKWNILSALDTLTVI